MKAQKIAILFLLIPLELTWICSARGEGGNVSGVVRGADGQVLAGARITLECAQSPASSKETTTDKKGEYYFDGVAQCEYKVNANANGFIPSEARVASITAKALRVLMDFTLTPISPAAPQPDAAQSKPPLKFQAAGVRGLIDSGGYSVSATAGAATGLISGMTDLKRADDRAEAAPRVALPCNLEPQLKHALEVNPDQAEANRQLGLFYVMHEQLQKGVPYLERAHQLNSSDDGISRDLVIALIKSGQFDSAHRLLATMAAQHPSAEIHQLQARAEEGSGRFVEAAREYQTAAQEVPSEENLFGAGYELILAGLSKDAGKVFEDGTKRLPISTLLRIGFGIAEFLQGHTSEGIAIFLQAAELKPSDPRPYIFLASAAGAWDAQGPRVLGSFERFWQLAPDNANANYYYALGLLDRRAGATDADRSKAEQLLNRAIELDPNFALAHFQLASLYAEHGDVQHALREYEIVARLMPEMKEAHYRLAGLYKQTGQKEKAANEMELFTQARDRQTASTISVEQFISVIDPPRPQGVPDHSCLQSAP